MSDLYGESEDAARFVEKAGEWLEEAEQEIENMLLSIQRSGEQEE